MQSKLKLFYITINFLILIINLCFFLSKTNHIKKITTLDEKTIFKFKNSDYFLLHLIIKNFPDISNYLNNKYIYNIFINLINKKTLFFFSKIFIKYLSQFIIKKIINIFSHKKKIILFSVDSFSPDSHNNWLKNKLKDKFIVKFDSNNPDYLIYNVFGNEHLNPKYNNSIKIAILTENIIPDFTEVDYAIGHYHISYIDRYFKSSIFLWRKLNSNIFFIYRNKVINNPQRKKFCSAVISKYYNDSFRTIFIKELDKYKKIDMGGKYNNNIGGPVINKIEFLSSYKFSIAMENSEGDGYISEKIIESFLAGTIPLYYGDYMVDEYINPKSYILIKGEKDIFNKIEYIKKIDNNDKLYKKFLKEKVLLEDNIKSIYNKEITEFLCNIFEQDKLKASRKYY